MTMNYAARKRRGLAKAPGKGRPYEIGEGTANTGQVPDVVCNRSLRSSNGIV